MLMDEMNDKKSLANDTLFDRVATILEEARSNVVRAVNSNMVIAYWLIGREIVQELQGGEERAAYGKKVIEDLSAKLTARYGRGFSTTNLRYFRTFYVVYGDRHPEIRQIGSGALANMDTALRYPIFLSTWLRERPTRVTMRASWG